MKKIVAIMLSMVMLISSNTLVYAENKVEESLENGELDEALLIDDSLVVLNNCEVVFEEVETTGEISQICVTINNIGEDIVNDWCLVYESADRINKIEDAEIAMQQGIHYIKSIDSNHSIAPNEAVTFSMEITHAGSYVAPKEFRVYCHVPEKDAKLSNSYSDCIDIISYNLEDGTYNFEMTDAVSYALDQEENNTNCSAGSDVIQEDEPDISPFSIIGKDERRKVTNVKIAPYLKIAALFITWPDNTVSYATGFMISNRYMLTAGHVIYNPKTQQCADTITAYFGRNGSGYSYKYNVNVMHYQSSIPDGLTYTNDWGVLEFNSDVGNNTGWFGIGYTTNDILKNMTITVTGFPKDKKVVNSQAEDGYSRYMYTSSSKVYSVFNDYFGFTADTVVGQSGSPVYKSDNYIVYGIHNFENPSFNVCRRITKDLFDSWMEKGWISN